MNDLEVVPVAPVNTDITFVFTLHMHCISIVRSVVFVVITMSETC